MHTTLYSIESAPAQLPVWELIHNDLGRPRAARIARVLGVGTSTVYRWHATGQAPRMACLALFWLTRWGHSHVSAQAANDAALYYGLARALTEERDQLRRQLAALNGPTAAPAALPPVSPAAPEWCGPGLSWPRIELA